LTVESGVQSGVPRLVKRRKLAVVDERSNTSLTGYCANLLVVVPLVAKENRYVPGIPLDE